METETAQGHSILPSYAATSPYITHCMGACSAKGEWSIFSLSLPLPLSSLGPWGTMPSSALSLSLSLSLSLALCLSLFRALSLSLHPLPPPLPLSLSLSLSNSNRQAPPRRRAREALGDKQGERGRGGRGGGGGGEEGGRGGGQGEGHRGALPPSVSVYSVATESTGPTISTRRLSTQFSTIYTVKARFWP